MEEEPEFFVYKKIVRKTLVHPSLNPLLSKGVTANYELNLDTGTWQFKRVTEKGEEVLRRMFRNMYSHKWYYGQTRQLGPEYIRRTLGHDEDF